MFAIIGIVVLLVLVFGTYVVAGGSIGVIMHALPIEMTIIGGAAVGATLVGNSMADIKALFGGIAKAFKGPKYNRQDFLDVIFLVSKLMKMLRTDGPVAVEPHIEDPQNSAIFAEYPKLLKDVDADPPDLRHAPARRRLVRHPRSARGRGGDGQCDQDQPATTRIAPANNLQTLADAFPALGIVAAVLGVVKTMASIDQPPAILGGMVASALVGTFLGVLLAYGFFGPFANRAKQVIEARRRDLRRRQADHHRLAARPSAAAGDRGGALGHRPCEPAGLRRRVRRHAGPLERWPRRPGAGATSRLPAGADHRQEGRRGGAWRASWRRLEDRLCRLRHRDDGLLPAALDPRRDRRGPAPRPRRLFHADPDRVQAEQRRIERHPGRRFDRRGGQLSAPRRPDRQPRDHHPARRHRRRPGGRGAALGRPRAVRAAARRADAADRATTRSCAACATMSASPKARRACASI